MKKAIASLFAQRTNALLACSAAVLLAACGGVDTGSTAKTAATVTTAQADSAANSAADSSAAPSSTAPLSAESVALDGYQQ